MIAYEVQCQDGREGEWQVVQTFSKEVEALFLYKNLVASHPTRYFYRVTEFKVIAKS